MGQQDGGKPAHVTCSSYSGVGGGASLPVVCSCVSHRVTLPHSMRSETFVPSIERTSAVVQRVGDLSAAVAIMAICARLNPCTASVVWPYMDSGERRENMLDRSGAG